MTSIEWFISQLEEKGDMRETPSIRNLQLNIDTSDYLELKRQAKEMHKQEIITAFDKGQEYEYQYHINNAPKFDSQTYYQETFVSGMSEKPNNHIEVELPQQEICINCDEEKETHEICMDCISKLIKENQQETLYTEEQLREAMDFARGHHKMTDTQFIQSLKQPKKD